jgi:UDP-2,3-diacylglucosamine pyrophosphatase LpxH
MLTKTFRQNGVITPPHLAVFSQPGKLFLDIRTDKDTGKKYLHFPYMAVSDIHWLSKYTRAKRLCMALQNIRTDRMDGVGDIVGGIEMMKSPTFELNKWHRQGMAWFLRKIAEGTEVNIIAGNHETDLRQRIGEGKTIYGAQFLPQTEYTDPKDRRFLIIHGDQYDSATVQSWYAIGDAALSAGYEIDRVLRYIPVLENFSVAAGGKRLVKTFINERMGIYKAIANDINASDYDGMIYGHSHMKGFHRTEADKLLINDGCCTDHVQFAVHDKYGNWGIIEYHKDRMDIEMEDGQEYSVAWKDLGLEHFGQKPDLIEDEFTAKADRLLRIAYRLWPPKERVALREEIRRREYLVSVHDHVMESNQELPFDLIWGFHQAEATLEELKKRLYRLPVPRSYVAEKVPLLAIA